MDISKVYVPDHQKWEKYYDVMLSQRLKENSSLIKPTDFLASSKNTSVPAK